MEVLQAHRDSFQVRVERVRKRRQYIIWTRARVSNELTSKSEY